jgi:hypothetical protein
MPQQITLSPPPKLETHKELGAYLNFGYRDSRKPQDILDKVDQFQEIKNIQEDNSKRKEQTRLAEKTVFNNQKIKDLLSANNYVSIGLQITNNKELKEEAFSYIIYNYANHQTLEINLQNRLQEISEIRRVNYQPAPTQKEISLAIEIARADKEVAVHVSNMVGQAIMIDNFSEGRQPLSGRLFDVQFGNPTERLPKYTAIVDIGLKKVLFQREISRQ